jgi:hypothetical protein
MNYWNKNAGLDSDDFYELSLEHKKKIIRLLACVMESAYRRGVQQTLVLKKIGRIDEWIIKNPSSYRYDKSLSASIGLDGFTTKAIERLEMEHSLREMCLYIK